MSKTQSITVTLGRKINIGNYEMLSVEVSETVILDKDETESRDACRALAKDVMSQLRTQSKIMVERFSRKKKESED